MAALVRLLGLCAVPCAARAEPLLVSVEGQAALAVSAPQADLFGPGGTIALSVRYPLAPELSIGAEVRGGLLSNGDPPADLTLSDPGAGSFELGMVVLRVRPLARLDGSGARRAVGLFADVGGGGGVTGEEGRAGFQAGLGYAIGLGSGLSLAPTLRYLQILQAAELLSGEDARLLLLGVELTAFDSPARVHARRAPPTPIAPPAAATVTDRDRDGIDDGRDRCRDQAEDTDGHRDEDGCPDPDNDGDGVADATDACADAAEDRDLFEDTDGCPERDNDRDGVADANDACVNDAEVVNGNRDDDGCPDEGLIVFENDRIVLDEHVVFDFERARVKSKARRVLAAIVRLKEQHPEWVELRVEGHADTRGNARFNQELSERRARHVMNALIELGIPAEQIQAVGFGATRPRVRGTDEESNQRNRRVEFVVIRRRPVTAAGEAAP